MSLEEGATEKLLSVGLQCSSEKLAWCGAQKLLSVWIHTDWSHLKKKKKYQNTKVFVKFFCVFWFSKHCDSGSQLESTVNAGNLSLKQLLSSTKEEATNVSHLVKPQEIFDVGVVFFQEETSAVFLLLTVASFFPLPFQKPTSSLCHVSFSSTWWTGLAEVWRPSVWWSVTTQIRHFTHRIQSFQPALEVSCDVHSVPLSCSH